MRESLFAIMCSLEEKSFLDLFSGSGIMAIEAVSRGAFPVEAVESDSGKREVLLRNVAIAGEKIRCKFIPVELYIKRSLSKSKTKNFDYIFCDPPFPYRFKKELLFNITSSPLMQDSSVLIMHHPKEELLDELPIGIVLQDKRVYGRSVVSFWQKK
jgi:16S rRNA (guanine(966)-N(2))-methyltransferase RsmD